ncbi:MAG TPA: methylmalonyl Co-A mutase-associated GTPase MeaB [Chloroflexota bacterium]|nr:methylmalonyl Co-A mutase-associated GTPase MeaB [Chloroflexota bacterium]
MTNAAPNSLVTGVLGGNRRAAGRAISRIEAGGSQAEQLAREIFPHTGTAYVVGVTGPPGAGKSSLVDDLAQAMRDGGNRVGIIAVDPNSPFSGGAVLGDRIRMTRHVLDEGVFIRSMGARGHLGGLAEATRNAVAVLDAMGMDIVLVETVGVGQSELEVAETADSTLVVIPPGLGDSVQALKAGIMEIADIFVVNKADHPQAERTMLDIRDLVHMDRVKRPWTPPIVKTVATEDVGVADLWIRIQQHRQYLERSGLLEQKRRRRFEREIVDIAERRVRERLLLPAAESDTFRGMLDRVVRREVSPYEAAETLMPVAAGRNR